MQEQSEEVGIQVSGRHYGFAVLPERQFACGYSDTEFGLEAHATYNEYHGPCRNEPTSGSNASLSERAV